MNTRKNIIWQVRININIWNIVNYGSSDYLNEETHYVWGGESRVGIIYLTSIKLLYSLKHLFFATDFQKGGKTYLIYDGQYILLDVWKYEVYLPQ